MKAKLIRARLAGKNHAVVSFSVSGRDNSVHRKTPCDQCPWRRDLPTGVFPAKAFKLSAPTSYDAAMSSFACHMSGMEKGGATCAGFLLSYGAIHNIAVRIAQATRGLRLEEVSSPYPLFNTYREMAVANGVSPRAPALRPCRDPERK